MGLSFDGTPDIQDRNRSQSSQMVDWRFFLETWPDNSVKMTMSSQSTHSMYDGVLYLHHLGFSKVNVELAHGVNWTKENIISYKTQLERLADYYVQHPEVHRISLLNIDIRKVLDKNVPNKKCGCGSNFSVYDTDGVRYPCHLFSPLVMTQEQLNGIKDIDFDNDSLFTNDICKGCLLRAICIGCCGMNYLYNHDVGKTPIVMCKLFQVQFLVNCKLQERLLTAYDNEYRKELQSVLNFVKHCIIRKR